MSILDMPKTRSFAIVNLMPHAFTYLGAEGTEVIWTLPPSGRVARVSTKVEATGHFAGNGVPCEVTTYGEITDLPPEQEGTLYLVSGLVAAAAPHRSDLVTPGRQERDPSNPSRVLGARSLSFPNR